LQEIQRGAFTGQQCARVADKLANDIVVLGWLAVGYVPVNYYGLIELIKNLVDPGLAGEYEGLSGDNRRTDDIVGSDERRRQVTATDVFSERVGDVPMYGSV
jgi:hypothetical protein